MKFFFLPMILRSKSVFWRRDFIFFLFVFNFNFSWQISFIFSKHFSNCKRQSLLWGSKDKAILKSFAAIAKSPCYLLFNLKDDFFFFFYQELPLLILFLQKPWWEVFFQSRQYNQRWLHDIYQVLNKQESDWKRRWPSFHFLLDLNKWLCCNISRQSNNHHKKMLCCPFLFVWLLLWIDWFSMNSKRFRNNPPKTLQMDLNWIRDEKELKKRVIFTLGKAFHLPHSHLLILSSFLSLSSFLCLLIQKRYSNQDPNQSNPVLLWTGDLNSFI